MPIARFGRPAVPLLLAEDCHAQDCISLRAWPFPVRRTEELERVGCHRIHKKLDSPDLDTWNKEMYTLRVFNQLIYNTDDNLTNVLISADWHLWMIDFTRAFRMHKNLAQVKNRVQCDRRLLAKMKELNKEALKEKMRRHLTGMEIDGLLARRDKIVKFFEDEVAKKGEATVLFDLPRVGQPCGTGL